MSVAADRGRQKFQFYVEEFGRVDGCTIVAN